MSFLLIFFNRKFSYTALILFKTAYKLIYANFSNFYNFLNGVFSTPQIESQCQLLAVVDTLLSAQELWLSSIQQIFIFISVVLDTMIGKTRHMYAMR
jgi:hypothetical protein